MGLVVTTSGKKKSKGVPMPLDTFLSNADDSWADVEDDYTPTEDAPRESYDNRGPPSPRDDGPRGRGDRYANRYADSAPPRRERDSRPQLPVPERAPFIAFVGNLSFSATEEDIGEFFSEHCGVESVRLIRDVSTNRSKGFGYVTFSDRESLVTALDANDVEVCGRPIHVDVAEGRQSEDRRGPSRADMADTWERGRTVPAAERPARNTERERERPGRDRGGRGFGSGRGRDREDFGEERRERKPLNLKPRSESAAPSSDASPKKGSNPFGDAKPRDESKFQERQREREAEIKKAAEARKAEREAGRDSGSERGGRGGKRGGDRGFRNRNESNDGRDFSQARSNMGKKPAPSPKSDEKKVKQAKPQTVQKESAAIPVGNIYSALKNQEA